ncbi:MAG: antibiotic biosynthesis monooxygenase [Eubacteriaceae bacterium]|nr:antibiotic biosynthesis monooxygenase [Eubacteriaceae bacterium]
MKTKENLMLNVTYTLKPGKRAEFFNELNKIEAGKLSKEEPGNIKYEYFYPIDSEDQLFLIEIWEDDAAFSIHITTQHFKKLQSLKEEYVADVSIEKYSIGKCL